ncbi:GNAT family N-acetyltransferase [Microbacteriaceae bacterium VKM Ac-2854]|nr:GNAT family N-acetyltransferase [Microbacteriaceae bacterium VKM Ac-2854]
MSIDVRPADQVDWADVDAVFGTRGDPATCWCQFFKLDNKGFDAAAAPDLKAALHRQIETGTPGLIAYRDGEPAGWVAVEPRPVYGRLRRTRLVAAGSVDPLDDASVWAVTCFVVPVGHRKQGVSKALLDAAVQFARENGARVVEGYPVDPTVGAKKSSAELYHGVLSVFEAAGFDVAHRPSASRALVRLVL